MYPSSQSCARAHRAVPELMESYPSSQACLRGHGVVCKLTELRERSQSCVRAHGVVSNSQSCVRFLVVVSKPTELCESSQSCVRAHEVAFRGFRLPPTPLSYPVWRAHTGLVCVMSTSPMSLLEPHITRTARASICKRICAIMAMFVCVVPPLRNIWGRPGGGFTDLPPPGMLQPRNLNMS